MLIFCRGGFLPPVLDEDVLWAGTAVGVSDSTPRCLDLYGMPFSFLKSIDKISHCLPRSCSSVAGSTDRPKPSEMPVTSFVISASRVFLSSSSSESEKCEWQSQSQESEQGPESEYSEVDGVICISRLVEVLARSVVGASGILAGVCG